MAGRHYSYKALESRVMKLNEEEKQVLYLWRAGMKKWEAWARVFRAGVEITDKMIPGYQTLASRFFAQIKNRTDYDEFLENVRPVSSSVDVGKGKYREDVNRERREKRQQEKEQSVELNDELTRDDDLVEGQDPAVTTLDDVSHIYNDQTPAEPLPEPEQVKPKKKKRETKDEKAKRTAQEQQQAWLATFTDIENPSFTTPYGLGLYLGAKVIQQINRREHYIADHKTSPMEKDGCPYTVTDVSAIKAVLAALLPFAPAPTATEQKAMTMAGAILGMTLDNIEVDPDAYTAPTPAGVKPYEEREQTLDNTNAEVIDIDSGDNS